MLDLLKEARVFEGCTTQELRDISKISQRMALQNGERVFAAQSPAEYLYIVAKGAVELKFTVTHYRVSKEITIDRVQQKEVFGWSALGKHRTYTLSALAVGDSELVRINAKDIEKFSAENNHLGFILMKNIAETIGERFDLVQRMLIDLIQQNLKEKEV
jgi:CRP-like cAMP-binding protein